MKKNISPQHKVTALLFATFGLTIACGELHITEFMADNDGSFVDADGDTSDWIEIYNSGPGSASLGGSFLTHDLDDLEKWRFPDVQLAEGEFLLVFASRKDRDAIGSELHTNFELENDGGYLALVAPDGITIMSSFGTEEGSLPEQLRNVSYGLMLSGHQTAEVIIEEGSTTRVHVPSNGSIGQAWTAVEFDDSSWDGAAMGIGYEDGNGYQSEFGEGGDLGNKMNGENTTVYLRIPFEVANSSSISKLILGMKYDDGFIAFLNGTRVEDANAPGAPAWDSEATANHADGDAITFLEFDLTDYSHLLRNGTNVLAIQGLNDGLTSSDMLISAELSAVRLTSPTVGGPGFLGKASPGSFNGDTFGGFVSDTKFSVDRGFFDEPFDVEIETDTEGAEIRYTLDGSPPSKDGGQIYDNSIRIAGTTVLRAMAHRGDYMPTEIDTQTYLFPGDVVNQSDMRTSITASQTYRPLMIDSLKAVPTISLVTGNTGFENEGGANIRDEYFASVEMIFPDGTPGFQENGGLSNYGGRFTNFPKKSFRVAFRSEFGKSKLKYPLFDGFERGEFPPADEFDVINLRSGSHDMVSRGAYMSNRFVDDSMLGMGNIAPHGRFVHVYLNGRYWGQYHLRERWSADMAASYFGGSEDDYEAVNANDNFQNDEEVYDGDGQFWSDTKDLVAGPQPFTNAAQHIDVANIVDFMLLWVSGNSESEFRSFGSATQGVPFKFMMKDADGFLRDPGHAADHAGPLSVMSRMRNSGDPDFAVLLADRIHKHFFNDGALTPAKNIERLSRRVEEARLGFISEAARWGDQFRDPSSWESYQSDLIKNHFPDLTRTMISRFQSAGMYPDIIAPVYSQHGGSVFSDTPITMATDADRIYYTLDGTDPRQSGGASNPKARIAEFGAAGPAPVTYIQSGHRWLYLDDGSDQGVSWRADGFDDSDWWSGESELGYGDDGEGSGTTIGFGEDASNKFPTTYFRTAIDIPDPSMFFHFILRVKYDDGIAVYVNGTERLRENLEDDADFDSFSDGTVNDEDGWKEFALPRTVMRSGINTFAVEIHQGSGTSSDIRFDMVLRGETSQGGGDNVSEPLYFSEPALLRARAYNTGSNEWSALNEAFFTIDSVPADSFNLIISEFHYHPEDPSIAQETAVSEDQDDFEFIEFLNIGDRTIDLTDVYFSDGITFSFPDHALLGSAERLLLVRDSAAFEARYGVLAGIQVFEYQGRLSNDGERLEIRNGSSEPILEFTYNDQAPWPTGADGDGFSLVLINPVSGPPLGESVRWAVSQNPRGGSPGTDEQMSGTTYESWADTNTIDGGPNDDQDRDGLVNYLEFLFGSNPTLASDAPMPSGTIRALEGEDAPEYFFLTYQENQEAEGGSLTVEVSGDLVEWSSDARLIETVSRVDNGDGTATVTVRVFDPVGLDEDPVFLRLHGH